ncbi:MAG: TIGR01777 family oxidoreductase [Bacteroidetes bacterium]|nr:TIGR01777 family oxidoreductase [Bacteroidota bacterium]MDA1119217.1 TIGR01777 family oxidoreductase [Bacteroidota bacterium]
MKILITGGSGLIGSSLAQMLIKNGNTVRFLSRGETNEAGGIFNWNIEKNAMDHSALNGVDAIVHLAGANVADRNWSTERKKEIVDSRVKSSELLFKKLQERNHNIKNIVAASAVGYYGMDTGDGMMDEESKAGNDFLANIVKQWEKATSEFRTLGIKTTQLRIGVVLDQSGGALGKMATPIKLGIGSPLGIGRQWMSWIHIEDLCRMIVYTIENQLDDVFNAVSPHPDSNKALTKALAKALKRPCFLPNVPSFVLKLIFGEMAQMILGGNRASSQKIEKQGFEFKFRNLEDALKNIYR